MQRPDHEEQDYRREPVSADDELRQGSRDAVEDDRPQGAEAPPSSFELLRRVILGAIQSVGDGAELISTSVAEELFRFRIELEHRVIVLLLFIAGVLAVGVGIMLFLRQIIGSWTPTLLIVGGGFLGVGILLSYQWRPKGDRSDIPRG